MNITNIPAIRGKIGTFTYYISSFTFEQISQNVRRIDDELHTSNSLREQIQRSLTNNLQSIKEYILTQKEHFFNSLVLAVYDGEPKWVEMEIDFKDKDYYNVGFLEFTGDEKIFPVDGQHRVEGIKEALRENPDLAEETIGVILIGHSKSPEGMEKTRRIFSTLNRYAKPVNLGDIIALDEDDTVAIVTRELLENYPLFKENRVRSEVKSKSISESDKTSFTSLITLYECNKDVFKYFRCDKDKKKHSETSIKRLLKFRLTNNEIEEFQKYLIDFWDNFCASFKGINEFIESKDKNPAEPFRNKKEGGYLYFRPVSLEPLVLSIMEIHKRRSKDIKEIMAVLASKEMVISKKPWINVLWEPVSNTMIMANHVLSRYLLFYMFDKSILTKAEMDSLKTKYAAALNIELKDVDTHLKELE